MLRPTCAWCTPAAWGPACMHLDPHPVPPPSIIYLLIWFPLIDVPVRASYQEAFVYMPYVFVLSLFLPVNFSARWQKKCFCSDVTLYVCMCFWRPTQAASKQCAGIHMLTLSHFNFSLKHNLARFLLTPPMNNRNQQGNGELGERESCGWRGGGHSWWI